MSNIKISFCIPTYNRSELLSELIESIVSQCENRNDIEICISDNASSDNTSEMVAKWKERTDTPIIYKVNNENIGPDRNYLAAVDLASGEYCWLFGSDDVLSENALLEFDYYLLNNSDIYLCDRKEYDVQMLKFTYSPWMCTEDKIYKVGVKEELIDYLNSSVSIGAIFSYLSSIIVKRELWKRVCFDVSFINSGYSHTFFLLDIMRIGCTLQYINKPLVNTRLGNDFFSQDGLVNRVEIDLKGYVSLAEYFYSDNYDIKKAFLNVLIRQRPIVHTNILAALYGNDEQRIRVKEYYIKMGVSENKLSLIYRMRPFYILANSYNLKSMYQKIRVFLKNKY
ncbi:glycosyltransferase family 2 protein [Yersinia bercovieri]|uniref:glycosyltransferase family 2 protein n=1 Tax=Yersinia bercovieri TaxID=634 RepID=UPI0005E4B083|nr:glycosyltransferase family 2 protein [Yersinia bercovieri]CFQ32131.1 putative glycosyltransferase [Yersinia bercovieri]